MAITGIVFGCFIPFHSGHQYLLDWALDECNDVIVAVCGYDGDRGDGFLEFEIRYNLTKKQFDGYRLNRCSVIKVDDHKIGLTGKFDKESWIKWSNELFNQAGRSKDENTIFRWYMGEPSYFNKLIDIHKDCEFRVADRSINPLSGTLIRQDFRKYKEDIAPLFYKELERRFPNEI